MSKIMCVFDSTGRQYVGSVDSWSENSRSIEIKEPILIQEIHNQSMGTIGVNAMPLYHNFYVPDIEVVWAAKFSASDAMIKLYEEILIKIRAARNGISIANNVPKDINTIKEN